MPFTNHKGARLYWQPQGSPDRPPLILMHSIGTEKGIFDRAAPFLEQNFYLIRLDLRGHGASQASAGDYSLALFAQDICAVMDAAGLGRALICGVSLGGMIAMQMALDSPDRVRGLVLACTSAAMSPALWPERIATVGAHGMAPVAEGWVSRHFADDYVRANPAQADTARLRLLAMDPVGYAGAAAAIRDMDLWPHLARITAPTLVIAGKLDIATPYQGHGEHIVAAIPGAELALLPASHLACIEQPELFSNSVTALAGRCA
jgi:3-oxoadipate enol-lactonase